MQNHHIPENLRGQVKIALLRLAEVRPQTDGKLLVLSAASYLTDIIKSYHAKNWDMLARITLNPEDQLKGYVMDTMAGAHGTHPTLQ